MDPYLVAYGLMPRNHPLYYLPTIGSFDLAFAQLWRLIPWIHHTQKRKDHRKSCFLPFVSQQMARSYDVFEPPHESRNPIKQAYFSFLYPSSKIAFILPLMPFIAMTRLNHHCLTQRAIDICSKNNL